jgi:hypothetical protein
MSVDLYTKAILTVIAACLLIIASQDAIRPVSAKGELQKVAICGWRNGVCADVGEITSDANQGTRVLLVADTSQ